jgi:membrane protease YdiL (CAAX protease family)
MNEQISLLEGRPFYFKFFVLVILILFGFTLIGGLGYFTVSNMYGLSPEDIATKLGDPENPIPVDALRIIQAFMSLGMFLIPALAYAQLSKEGVESFYGFGKKIPNIVWLLVAALFIAVSPFIDGLIYIFYHLPYPEFLNGFVQNLIDQQELISTQMAELSQMDNLMTFGLNLLIMAALPAIGEEWLFRGVIQKLFKEKYSVHKSVWITAFFFAILHQSIFYFIGLFLLGALLGYLKEWSGNIWLPVFGHFFNNSIVLIVSYFMPELIGDLNTMEFDTASFLLGAFISVALTFAIYSILQRFNSNATNSQITKEEI